MVYCAYGFNVGCAVTATLRRLKAGRVHCDGVRTRTSVSLEQLAHATPTAIDIVNGSLLAANIHAVLGGVEGHHVGSLAGITCDDDGEAPEGPGSDIPYRGATRQPC